MFSEFLIYINVPLLICLDPNGTGVCSKFIYREINSKKVTDFATECCPDFFEQDNTCQLCPAGTYGVECKNECSSNYYGLQCKNMCNCLYGSVCDSVQGCIHYITENSTNRSTTQASVILSVNQHIKRYSYVSLNCTSDTVPTGQVAYIDVNGKLYTSITLQNETCFSGVLGMTCKPDICACSTRGLWYSHIYKVVEHEDVLEISCYMIFKSQGILTSSRKVNITDTWVPHIKSRSACIPVVPALAMFASLIVLLMMCVLIKKSNICAKKRNVIKKVKCSTQHHISKRGNNPYCEPWELTSIV